MLAIASTEHWYQSGTTWTAVGAIAVVVVGVLTVGVSYFVSTARPVLNYGLVISIPLLSLPTRPDLEVLYKGHSVQNPRVLMISLANSGRRDISSSMFDQQRPIVFEIGIPIVDVLGEDRHGELVVEETSVRIPPRLIRRKEEISISLLCDGRQPQLRCESHLIDVKVKSAMLSITPFLWFLLPLAKGRINPGWWRGPDRRNASSA